MSSDATLAAKRPALLIVNPKARSGQAALDAAFDVLSAGGLDVIQHPCREDEPIADVIRARAGEVSCVIVGGGDGTMNAAVPGLIDAGLPLGILPLGTANDLARTLGIAPDPVEAAAIIAAGHLRAIDVGEVNGRPYFNVASIGFSAELAQELTSEAKKRWGTLGYAIAAARLLMRTRPFTAHIEHDGARDTVRTIQISVGNGRHYGGGMTVESTAEPDDGRLDFYSLELDHWWRLVALFPYLRAGTHGTWRDVRAFQTTACTIHTRRPMQINTDGELTSTTPAHFRLIEKAVQVYAPRPQDAA